MVGIPGACVGGSWGSGRVSATTGSQQRGPRRSAARSGRRASTRASVAGFDDRSEFVDYYEVLGVDPTADVASVRMAWRRAMKRVHPDVLMHDAAASRAKTGGTAADKRDQKALGRDAVLANNAWEVLSGVQRAAYDAQRQRVLMNGARVPVAERWTGARPPEASSWPWDTASSSAGPSRLHVTGDDAEEAAREARAWALRADTPDELLAMAVNQAVDAAREARGEPDAAVLAAARVVALREVARGRENLRERGGRFYLDRKGGIVDALPLAGPLFIVLGLALMWMPRMLFDAPYYLASSLP